MLSIFLQNIESPRDRKRFMELYDRYNRDMHRYACSILKDYQLAEDAVNEAFFRLSLNFSKIVEKNCRQQERYIVIVVRNLCFDMLRKQKRAAEAERLCADEKDSHTMENAEDSLNDLMGLVGYNQLLEVLRTLPDIYRIVLHLRCVQEYSTEETADILNVSTKLVNKRMERARKLLLDYLEGDK